MVVAKTAAKLNPQPWISLLSAAQHLGEPADSLRKKLDRASRQAVDGVTEAKLDGLTARKLGRRWKVRLSPGWQ